MKDKKYKILVVHNYYKTPGGEDTVVDSECKMLVERGHEIFEYFKRNDDLLDKGIIKKMKLFFQSIFSFRSYKEVKQIIKNNSIDIVHVHNTLPLISPSVYYAAFHSNTPVIQTIHNFRLLAPCATLTRNGSVCEECISIGLRSSLKYKCYRNSFLQTFAVYTMLKIHRLLGTYTRINGFIALTEFNKNKLSSLLKNRNNIHVKSNFLKPKDSLGCERHISNYFVFIGRLDKLKGIDFLVHSWGKNLNSELIIIGDGPEKEKIQTFISENNLENIKLFGFMNREKAFEIIKNAIAVIVPSQWYEGFPMTIVEAFALGVPVLGSDIGNLSYIINEQNGILFKHDDECDLLKGINILINDRSLVEKLSIGAFATYNELYTDKINYAKLHKIYNKVCQSQKCL